MNSIKIKIFGISQTSHLIYTANRSFQTRQEVGSIFHIGTISSYLQCSYSIFREREDSQKFSRQRFLILIYSVLIKLRNKRMSLDLYEFNSLLTVRFLNRIRFSRRNDFDINRRLHFQLALGPGDFLNHFRFLIDSFLLYDPILDRF